MTKPDALFEKTIPVTRVRQQHFAHKADQWCRWCGVKGVYEGGDDDIFCFHCTAARPQTLHDPHSLELLMKNEGDVTDRIEYVEMISPIDQQLDEAMNVVIRGLGLSMFGPK